MMDTVAAARAVDGRAVGAPVTFARVTTDSRAVAPGDLFVALQGERFDGHDFVHDALRAGAAAAVVADARAGAFDGSLIAVGDPQAALAALARHWRMRFAIPVVAVVGSNGKTTTKEMIASIFREAVGTAQVHATSGNFNNAIGLPLTLLGLHSVHRLAVVEIGMNHRGETAELAAIAQPTVVAVTNAQREHQEFMRSVADVAREHADAIAALRSSGTAVVNADDEHAPLWRDTARAAGARVVDFGLVQPAGVTARHSPRADGADLVLATAHGDVTIALGVPGRHMAENALAAAAVALALDLAPAAIARALASFRAIRGRLMVRDLPGGVRIIDDTYNANPDSVRAAIDVLGAAAGTRRLALGDMGEVGTQGPAFHREVGAYARAAGVSRLYATGEATVDAVRAFGDGALHFADADALAARLRADLRSGDTVLVKGSRFMRMERVVAALADETVAGAH
ncbi:MAG: UDP-N-acetylmuramoyl-tripeptide--D-alanyl-D-alanine ligase [Betaproteobacteria bacterium]